MILREPGRAAPFATGMHHVRHRCHHYHWLSQILLSKWLPWIILKIKTSLGWWLLTDFLVGSVCLNYFPREATSSHLIERLKNFFCIFGIPEEYQVTMGHNSSQPSWNSSSRAGGWRTTESVQHIIHIVTYEQRQLSNQVNGYLWTIQDLMDHQIGTE